jgi:hypothetical protein
MSGALLISSFGQEHKETEPPPIVPKDGSASYSCLNLLKRKMRCLTGNHNPGNQHGAQKRSGVNVPGFAEEICRSQTDNRKYRQKLEQNDKNSFRELF